MPIDAHSEGLDYSKVSDNADRALEDLRVQISEIGDKNRSLLDRLGQIQTTGINPGASFSEQDFEKANNQLKQFTDNIFELTQLSNDIFDTYGVYVADSMSQLEQYNSDLSEAMNIMQNNQQKFDDIKRQIIERTQNNETEVDEWLAGIETSFVDQIRDRIAIQEDTFKNQTNIWLNNLWAIKEKETANLLRFQVQALLKTMIVNLSTQLIIENLAVVIKEKIETIDDTRVFLTQELNFVKNSLSLFKEIYYTYTYGDT